jgi:hypothetical protein
MERALKRKKSKHIFERDLATSEPLEALSCKSLATGTYSISMKDLQDHIFQPGYKDQIFDHFILSEPSLPIPEVEARQNYTSTNSEALLTPAREVMTEGFNIPDQCKEKTLVFVHALVQFNNGVYLVNVPAKTYNTNHIVCVVFYRVKVSDKWEATLYDANISENKFDEKIEYGRSSHAHKEPFKNLTKLIDIISNSVVGHTVNYRIGQLGIHDTGLTDILISGSGICYIAPAIILALMITCKSKLATNGAEVIWNVNRALDYIHSRPGAFDELIKRIYKGRPIPQKLCMKPASMPYSLEFANKIRSSITGHSGPLNKDLSRVKTHLLKHSYDKQRSSRRERHLKFQPETSDDKIPDKIPDLTGHENRTVLPQSAKPQSAKPQSAKPPVPLPKWLAAKLESKRLELERLESMKKSMKKQV